MQPVIGPESPSKSPRPRSIPRNHTGKVVDRVEAGEHVIVTRDGRPVAELRPVRGPALTAQVLLDRQRWLPRLDPDTLRVDLDGTLDPRL